MGRITKYTTRKNSLMTNAIINNLIIKTLLLKTHSMKKILDLLIIHTTRGGFLNRIHYFP